MTKQEIKNLALLELSRFPELKGWRFDFHKKKNSLGTCIQSKKTIYISELMAPYLTDKAIRNTILHEIAHALTPNCGHNYTWRHTCIQIGGNGKTKADVSCFTDVKNYRKSTSKYILTCPNCGTETYNNRLTETIKISACSKCCKGVYNPAYKWLITQNY